MLKRISSGFIELRRALSWSKPETPTGPNQNQNSNTQNEEAAQKQNQNQNTTPSAPVNEEREAFDKTLDIVRPSSEMPLEVVELPYALGGYSVDAAGHLRAYANTGFVGEESLAALHGVLRSNPGVAAAVKSLHIVLQGPKELDLESRDSTMATQRRGLGEWSRTIPALVNLERVRVSHYSALGEDVVYVPGEDEAEEKAAVEERGRVDVSAVVKSLAWYAERLAGVELEGVDISEEAAKAFEGSGVTSLKLVACPTRVSTIIPRLSKLSEVVVTEKGDLSVGCDYVSLLSHVKVCQCTYTLSERRADNELFHSQSTLTAVTLNLHDSKIDLQEFTTALSGAPLTTIQCPFADLTEDEANSKLKDAFPTFGRPASAEEPEPQQHEAEPSSESTVPSTPVKKAVELDDMEVDSTAGGISGSDAEMGMLSERNSTPTRRALKRSALVEKRKEELKAAEMAASKEKLGKITTGSGVPRKLRSTPSRHK